MDQHTRPDSTKLSIVAGAILGICVLLLLRRYNGITHDSILYLGQGLMQRWPAIYGTDLFFQYGSQSEYTVLPWLLGRGFGLVDPPVIFLLGTLLSLLLFAAASWFCLKAVLPTRQRYWAWLGALCLPSIYGTVHIFSYNEPFLTSRPIAESFSLLSIGFLARRRYGLAVACLTIAGLFHPLQVIGAILVVWSWAVLQDRRWLHAAWLSIPVLLLAFTGVKPFDGLVRQVDAAWLAELKYSPQLFVTSWNINDFKTLGFDVLVLACGWRMLDRRFGQWSLAALAGLALGTVASLALVDGLHLVLPTGLQLWRVHWLAHWFSLAAIAALLFHHVRVQQWVPVLLLSLAALLAWGETDWGWLLLGVMYLAWPLLPDGSRRRLAPLLTWILGIAVALLFANHASNEFHWFKEAHYRLDLYPFDRRLLAFPAISLGLPLLAVIAWERLSSQLHRRLLLVLMLCPLALLTIFLWDSRNTVQRAIEDAAFRTDIFGVSIEEHAVVYWEPESLVATWLILRSPSYFSQGQLAGQMFSRATAAHGLERENRLMPFMQESMNCRRSASTYPELAGCRISDDSMRRACTAIPKKGPDYLVLPYRQPQHAAGSWVIRDRKTGRPDATFWLYRCPDVVAELTAHPR